VRSKSELKLIKLIKTARLKTGGLSLVAVCGTVVVLTLGLFSAVPKHVGAFLGIC
jgi:hypothetical protein